MGGDGRDRRGGGPSGRRDAQASAATTIATTRARSPGRAAALPQLHRSSQPPSRPWASATTPAAIESAIGPGRAHRGRVRAASAPGRCRRRRRPAPARPSTWGPDVATAAHHADEASRRPQGLGEHRATSGASWSVNTTTSRSARDPASTADGAGGHRRARARAAARRAAPGSRAGPGGRERPRHVGRRDEHGGGGARMWFEVDLDVAEVVGSVRVSGSPEPDLGGGLHGGGVELGAPERAVHLAADHDRHRGADPARRLAVHPHRLRLDARGVPVAHGRIGVERAVLRCVPGGVRAGRSGEQLHRVRHHRHDRVEPFAHARG